MADNQFFVIINPNANTGRLGKNMDKVLKTFKEYLGDFEYRLTEAPRQEVKLATEAIERGFNTIIACGGDGTATNTGDAIINSGKKDIKLGLVSGGSMCDWHKTHSIPYNLEESLSIIAEGYTEFFPAMRSIGEQTYYSFDMADGGFTGATAAAAHTEAKWIKNGDLKYMYLALKYILRTKNTRGTVTIDDNDPITFDRLTNVIAAYGDEIAGFKVLPGNDYLARKNNDFGILIAYNFKGLARLHMLFKALNGNHTGMKNVWLTRGRKITVETEDPMPWEAEGEIFNKNGHKVTIEHVENAIQLLVPKERKYNDWINEEVYNFSFEQSKMKRKVKVKKR